MFHLYPVELKGLEQEFRAVKFLKAIKLAEEIINSPEFKQWFMAYEFKQLYDLKFRTKYHLLDMMLVTIKFTYSVVKRPWYKRYSSVIGYTIGDDVHTYRDSYDNMDLPRLVNHIVHEALHCSAVSFSHSVQYTKERDHSLNYTIGDYCERAAIAKIKE